MLTDVLADLSILLGRLIGEMVELRVVHGRDLWAVMADVNQLEQVVMNLAVNARDAMPDGGRLTIRTFNVPAADLRTLPEMRAFAGRAIAPADHVMIEIADTGTGMPAETMEKIFEPFFTTKEVGKGTGLGLSTVYGIVTQSGGHIAVESEIGKGTVFRIVLPRAASAERADAGRSETARAEIPRIETARSETSRSETPRTPPARPAAALQSDLAEAFSGGTGVEPVDEPALEAIDRGDPEPERTPREPAPAPGRGRLRPHRQRHHPARRGRGGGARLRRPCARVPRLHRPSGLDRHRGAQGDARGRRPHRPGRLRTS